MYAFEFQGHGVFEPDGKVDIPASQVAEHNKQAEAQEIERLKTHPDKVFLYVGHDGWTGQRPNRLWRHSGVIKTWLGTVLDTRAYIGSDVKSGFNGARRASVDCHLFGVRYVGWYYHSSGDYCRLRRAKT